MTPSYRIDFLKYRFVSLLFSVALFGGAIGTYFYRMQQRGYAFNYSVEFTGGTQTLLGFTQPISSLKVKDILESEGWSGTVTRDFSDTEVLVRIKDFSNDVTGTAERIRQTLATALPENTVQTLQTDSVSSATSESLQWDSLRAVIFALIAMLCYIAFRFWGAAYAVGAVVAIFHDALAILSCFLLFDQEISVGVMGAILVTLGYSINDTIVIFSKIRENLKALRGTPLRDMVNISLNQTLTRTLLTSISTALAVGSVFILGGEALRGLSFALLLGIVFGTYSSIFIASPIMLLFPKKD